MSCLIRRLLLALAASAIMVSGALGQPGDDGTSSAGRWGMIDIEDQFLRDVTRAAPRTHEVINNMLTWFIGDHAKLLSLAISRNLDQVVVPLLDRAMITPMHALLSFAILLAQPDSPNAHLFRAVAKSSSWQPPIPVDDLMTMGSELSEEDCSNMLNYLVRIQWETDHQFDTKSFWTYVSDSASLQTVYCRNPLPHPPSCLLNLLELKDRTSIAPVVAPPLSLHEAIYENFFETFELIAATNNDSAIDFLRRSFIGCPQKLLAMAIVRNHYKVVQVLVDDNPALPTAIHALLSMALLAFVPVVNVDPFWDVIHCSGFQAAINPFFVDDVSRIRAFEQLISIQTAADNQFDVQSFWIFVSDPMSLLSPYLRVPDNAANAAGFPRNGPSID